MIKCSEYEVMKAFAPLVCQRMDCVVYIYMCMFIHMYICMYVYVYAYSRQSMLWHIKRAKAFL